MSENEIVLVLLFGNKGSTKDRNPRIVAYSICLINSFMTEAVVM